MGLSQSLYTGYSGMATHQRSLDNTSNNLANINTVGFKKSDFLFSNLMSKVMTGAMEAEGDRGAVNPVSVGLGVSTGAILNNFRPGSIENTGNPMDVAIGGNGFFLASTPYGLALTRNGSFYLDHTQNPRERLLCVGDGLVVQGWLAQDGAILPGQNITNVVLPAIGDLLPGRNTANVGLTGILPTNQSGPDFNGRETSSMELKGNLQSGGGVIRTHIFASVSQTDGNTSTSGQIQEIPVEIVFSGPAPSPDGGFSSFAWTMSTVDWPRPGDPPRRIYPASGADPGTVDFFTSGSASQSHGAGQSATSYLRQESVTVESVTPLPDGGSLTSSFKLASGFTMDFSRLANLPDAPGGNALDVWHVNGNPRGSMARTITVYDEYTAFVETADAYGNALMEPVRRVQAREDTLYFRKTLADNSGTEWAWRSTAGDASGTLRFNANGDLVYATQPGGGITYDFSGIRNINYDASLQAASQDGYPDGYLENLSFDQHGKIYGHYSNKVTEALAQLALGTVPNLSGLEGASGTLFYPGSASGAIMIGIAGDADGSLGLPAIGAGYISAGCLEGSNVDLSQEFSSLISTERGYQLNSRVVSTSDEMLQTALQLKR